jgi:ferric-dicitrate binding protein FerR (iron transport regulator)
MGFRTRLCGVLIAALPVVASAAPADAAQQQAYLDRSAGVEFRIDANMRRFLVSTPTGRCAGTYLPGRVRAGRQRVVVEKNTCNVDVSTDQRYARGKVELAGGQSYRFVARDLRTALRGRSGPILRPTLQT